MRKVTLFFILVFIFSSLLIVDAQDNKPEKMKGMNKEMNKEMKKEMKKDMKMMHNINKAVAILYPASGSNVHGTVVFTKESDGIKIVADIDGLTPGKHGFHIHEFGDCSASDAKTAGEHFSQRGEHHGAPDEKMSHEGDMGNITADNNGKAHFEWMDKEMTFMGPRSIIGRGVVVHGGTDDLKSQPAGNSGARVACGVIGISK